MFLRVKKIKGKEYCYLVENVWTKKGARQEVKCYLGRVYSFKQDKNDFFDYHRVKDVSRYLKKRSKKEIVTDLVVWELGKLGFKEKGKFLMNKEVTLDSRRLRITKNGRDVAVKLNEGFLCGFTLKRLLKFKKSDEIEHDSVVLAKYFVEAGIDVPQELFIGFFEKV